MMVDPQNYEHHFPMKFWPFFKTKWPLLVVFCSLVSLVNKIQLVKAIWPFKKVIYSRESAIHSFSYPNIHSFYYECRKGAVKQITDLTSDNYLKDVFINKKVEISYSCY